MRFELSDSRSRQDRLPQRIRVSWQGGPPVRSGERWRLAVTLKRPSGLLNFQGFDQEAWLLAQRVGATGSVKDGQRLASARHAWRDGVRQQLLAVDARGRGRAGRTSAGRWLRLGRRGLAHLCGIPAPCIYWSFPASISAVVGVDLCGLARYGCWPRRFALAALGLRPGICRSALAYGLLAGFAVPVQRALCVMVGLVLLWRLRFRHLGIWWPLLLALNACSSNPLASLQPGFWLSFAAVAVLLLAFSGRLGPWRAWQAWTRAQWLIAVGCFRCY